MGQSKERILQAAEQLFVERGYEAITVKDIAKAAGLHHASIYHHIPGGKSALFVEVMTRHMERHKQGIREAIKDGQDDLRRQLQQIAAWFIAQPPLDIVRLANSDFPAIPDVDATRLSDIAHVSILLPLCEVLEDAQKRGEIDHPNLGNIAGALFSAIEGLHSIPDIYVQHSRQSMANEIIDVFIRGMQKE